MKINFRSEEYGISPAMLRDGTRILNVKFLMKKIVVQRYSGREPSRDYESVYMHGYGLMYIYNRLNEVGAFPDRATVNPSEEHAVREEEIYNLLLMRDNLETVTPIFVSYVVDMLTILFNNAEANKQHMFDELQQIVIAGHGTDYQPIFDGVELFVNTCLPQ